MSLSNAIKVMNKSINIDHENMKPYRIAQLTILNMMNIYK